MLLRTRVALAATAAMLLAAVSLIQPARQADAGAQDPEAVVQQIAQMLSLGDETGLGNLAAEDIFFTNTGLTSFGVVGRPAFRIILEETIALDPAVDIIDTEVDGNVVTGSWEWSDDDTDAAGVTRFIELFTFEISDAGKVVRADVRADLDDAETLQFQQYLLASSGEEEEDGAPPGLVIVSLAAQAGGNQPGSAFIVPIEAGVTGVDLRVTPGAEDVLQPAHFHTGSCGQPGPIVYPLASVLNGGSFTLISAEPADLVDAGLIINVHKSPAEPGSYVSCGSVLSAAAAPTPAPAATATPRTGVTAPDTGSGGAAAARGAGGYVWIVAVLALGVTAVIGGALARRRNR